MAIGSGPGTTRVPWWDAGQEVGGPDLRAGVGHLRREHDERRQVPVRRAQAVADPRADARPGERERAGVHAERRVVVVRVARVHRADQGDVVDLLAEVREQVADLDAALAARRELPVRLLEEELLVAGPVARLRVVERDLLAVVGDRASAWGRTNRRARRRRS